ncbi:MAG: hypothetical protein V3W28_07200 [Thermoplasmata archaeon]
MLRWNLLPVLVLTLSLFAFPPAEARGRSSGEVALVSPLSHLGNGTGPGPGYFDASEFMMGNVAVGVFLVESTGSARDWSDEEVNETLEGIYAGLDWWAAQEPRARLSFSYELHIRASTSYEPTLLSLNDDYLWIDEILTDLGYTEPDPWSKALHFSNDLRESLATDWALSLFVADSEDALNMGRFTNDQYAHAYLGGPWIAMSRFSSWAYNSPDYHRVVPAHEMGHIFYASDEYDTAPPQYSGYLNCPDNNGVSGIMNRNTLAVSESTRCQIGWIDSDENDIFDILDVPPETTLHPEVPDPTSDVEIVYEGTAQVVPLPNRNLIGPGNDVTISRIAEVEMRVDEEFWFEAKPQDGAFDEFVEAFVAQVQLASSVNPLPVFVNRSAFVINATTPLLPGTHLAEARARNSEGTLDPTPAADSLTNTENPLSSVELWYSTREGSYVPYAVIREQPWSWTFYANATGGDGVYAFYSLAQDKNGNYEEPPTVPDAATMVDTHEPILTVGGPGNGWLPYSSPIVEWTMEDDGSGIASAALRLDGGPWMDIGLNTSQTFRDLQDGVHIVEVRAGDRAGLSRQVSLELRIDLTPPQLTIQAPNKDAVLSSSNLLAAWQGEDATSGIARYLLRLDNGTVMDAGLNTSHFFTGIEEGSHIVSIVAYDAAGNWASANVTFSRSHPETFEFARMVLSSPLLWLLAAILASGLVVFHLGRGTPKQRS